MTANTDARSGMAGASLLAEFRPDGGWNLSAQAVQVHSVEDTSSRRWPYVVRVVVDGRETTSRFHTWIEADTFHAEIERARAAGERFDPSTGRPSGWPSTGPVRLADVDLERLRELVAACDPAGDRRWLSQAACSGDDTNRFYPERGGDLGPPRAVCRRCPVQEQCLVVALARGEKFGVWGGRSERERRAIRRALSARDVAVHRSDGRRCEHCNNPVGDRSPKARFCSRSCQLARLRVHGVEHDQRGAVA